MIKKFKIFEEWEWKEGKDVMGIPSGEYLSLPDDVVTNLFNKGILKYSDKYQVLCFRDKDYYTMLSYLNPVDEKQKIKKFLSEIGIVNYHINEELKVDVWQNIKIRKKLSKLPIKFDYILGDFDVSNCGLESLYGCPEHVDGNFICVDNNLFNLKEGPLNVTGNYDVQKSGLYDLEGSPKKIKKNFDCSYNYIKDLKGSPRTVEGSFYCSNCLLESLEGSPDVLSMNFDCSYNHLKSLKGGPDMIQGTYDCSYNQLNTIEGAPTCVGTFKYIGNEGLRNTRISDFPICDKLVPDKK